MTRGCDTESHGCHRSLRIDGGSRERGDGGAKSLVHSPGNTLDEDGSGGGQDQERRRGVVVAERGPAHDDWSTQVAVVVGSQGGDGRRVLGGWGLRDDREAGVAAETLSQRGETGPQVLAANAVRREEQEQ